MTNLSHGELLSGSLQILVQSVAGLLVPLCGGGHLLAFLSEGGDLFPVALHVVLKHLVPDVETFNLVAHVNAFIYL